MTAVRRWVVASPVLLVLGVLGLAAGRTGLANTETYGAAREIASWATLARGPQQGTIDSIRQELLGARKVLPLDAAPVELLGVVEARDRGNPQALELAIDHFRSAVRLRPVSPYPWANLVHASYQSGMTGPKFEHALRTAGRLGPWEPEVQATLVNYGLAVREEVGPATRGAVDLAVASAMRRNPLETLQIAERRGRLDVACAGVNWETGAKRFLQCQEWEKRP